MRITLEAENEAISFKLQANGRGKGAFPEILCTARGGNILRVAITDPRRPLSNLRWTLASLLIEFLAPSLVPLVHLWYFP